MVLKVTATSAAPSSAASTPMRELRDRAGRGEAPRPHGVGLHVGHAGQLAELAGDVLPRA